MKPFIAELRRNICATCPHRCPEIEVGEIKHTNPCQACPVGVWPAFNEPGCPKVVDSPQKPKAKPRISRHPGEMLHWCIWKITGQQPGNCQCGDRIRTMNQLGWWGCWKHRAQIVEWLVHEAQTRGHKIEKSSGRALIKAAFKEFFSSGKK